MILKCLAVAVAMYAPPEIGEQTFGIALEAIAEVEGGYAGLESQNDNGTADLGRMQINTIWVPELAQAWGRSQEEAKALLRDNECRNVVVAAYILSLKVHEAGSLWGGIRLYHSATPDKADAYQAKVVAVLQARLKKEAADG